MTAGLMELSLRAASPVLGPVMVAVCPTQAGGESSVGFPRWAAAGDTNPLGGRAAWASRREGEREGSKQPLPFLVSNPICSAWVGEGAAESPRAPICAKMGRVAIAETERTVQLDC